MKINKFLYFLALITLLLSCNSSPNNPSQTYIPNEESLEVVVDSVLKANKISVIIKGKSYIVSVLDLEVFESEKNEILSNQAILAGVSEDSALVISVKSLNKAKELLLGKQITIKRDSYYGNSNSKSEYLRHVLIGGERYDSIMKALNLNAPRKPHPDDKDFYAKVNWVYDGDTFDYKYDGTTFKVRILNIDCYETQINDRLSEQAGRNGISVDSALTLGLAAKEFAIETLKGKTILLRRYGTAPNKDVYDRYLRWVEVDGMKYDSLIKAKGYDSD